MKSTAHAAMLLCVFATACAVDDEAVLDAESSEVGGAPAWAGPVPLSPATRDAQVRYNFGKSIAIDPAGVVHVTWLDIQGSDLNAQAYGDVYYQRSATGGTSWSAPRKLSSAPGVVSFPKIAASGPYVYVVWHLATPAGSATSYLARSTDQGLTFSTPTAVTTQHSATPSLAAHGSGVHVVFSGVDQTTGTSEIYVQSSTDFGVTWRPTRRVSAVDNSTSWTPVIAANGLTLHVAWTDERHNRNPDGTSYDCGKQGPPAWAGDDGCREEVYYRSSTNLGTTWGAEQRLTTSPQGVGHNAASLVVAAGTVHISYFRKPVPQNATLYRRSTNAGASFLPETIIENSLVSMRPCVAALGDVVGIAYTGIVSGVGAKTYFARSTDRGATFLPSELVVEGNGESLQPSLELDPTGQAHVIFTDRATPTSTSHRVFYARTLPN